MRAQIIEKKMNNKTTKKDQFYFFHKLKQRWQRWATILSFFSFKIINSFFIHWKLTLRFESTWIGNQNKWLNFLLSFFCICRCECGCAWMINAEKTAWCQFDRMTIRPECATIRCPCFRSKELSCSWLSSSPGPMLSLLLKLSPKQASVDTRFGFKNVGCWRKQLIAIEKVTFLDCKEKWPTDGHQDRRTQLINRLSLQYKSPH